MKFIQSLSLIVCLSSFCSCQTADESYEYVIAECNQRLQSIDSISKFQEFVKHFNVLVGDKEKPKKGWFNQQKRLRKCYDLEEQIRDLNALIESRQGNVCKVEYVERLAEFHFKHLASESQKRQAEKGLANDRHDLKSSYLARFFSMYAHQVAYTCKSRLSERILIAQKQQDCSNVISRFIPANISPGNSNTETGNDMVEVANFLSHFKRVENFAPIMNIEKSNALKPYFDVMIPDSLFEKISSLKEECLSKKPYYSALFSPIAALAQLGYSVYEPKIDSDDMENDDTKLFKCWLATAQLCQGILLTHLTVVDNVTVDPDLKSRFMSIKWGAAPVESDVVKDNLVQYDDNIEEISPAIRNLVGKRTTFKDKVKSKTMSWAKKIIERHIDLEATQNEATRKFLEALTSFDNDIDSKVAFAGKKFDDKKFNPVSIITDEADAVVMYSSPLWGKEIGLLVSSIVAVAMSAVFVWFSLYAIVTTLKQQYFSPKDHANFKAEWKELRNQRVASIEGKLAQKKPLLSVYKPI